MFTRTQWFEFFRCYGLDSQDAQAAAEQAFQDQFADAEPARAAITAQPRQLGPIPFATLGDILNDR